MRASTLVDGLDLATSFDSAQLEKPAVYLHLHSYREEPFLDLPGHLSRPNVRQHSPELRVSLKDSEWRVRVTFQAVWPRATARIQRKSAVEHFCRQIRFERIALLDDTVTEVILSAGDYVKAQHPLPLLDIPAPAQSDMPLLRDQWYYVREDPSRVQYPGHTTATDDMPAIYLSTLTKVDALAPAVHVVRLSADDGRLYVYKTIDRPLYVPGDTAMLEHEFRNLRLLRGVPNIVRLEAAITSPNPYRTRKPRVDETDDQAAVLRGLLLEYHPNGSLKDVMSTPSPLRRLSGPLEPATPGATPAGGSTHRQHHPHPWRGWAQQVARAVQSLHDLGLTHMDLKPHNVVISQAGEAVLIDVSGRAVTQEYLAPELWDAIDPAALGFDVRVSNDCWALGKMFKMMADVAGTQGAEDITGKDRADRDTLANVAAALMHHDPQMRIPISEAISQMQYE